MAFTRPLWVPEQPLAKLWYMRVKGIFQSFQRQSNVGLSNSIKRQLRPFSNYRSPRHHRILNGANGLTVSTDAFPNQRMNLKLYCARSMRHIQMRRMGSTATCPKFSHSARI